MTQLAAPVASVDGEPPSEAPIHADLVSLLTIRHFETMLLDLFATGAVHGTTHTCLGQEYVPVALRDLCAHDDVVFSNHRGHGHYLALFDDAEGLLCEILGKEGALCQGVGGSQHLYRKGFISTGIQAEGVLVACGVAVTLKRRGNNSLALAFVGDGTWGQGGLYEALNLASLRKLPLVIVVENNGIAQSTPTRNAMAGSIEARAVAFDAAYVPISVNDVSEIRSTLRPFFESVRSGGGPLIVEFFTDRLGPHSKGDDTRPESELRAARVRDWYPAYQNRYPDLFARIEVSVKADLAQLFDDVKARAPTTWIKS